MSLAPGMQGSATLSMDKVYRYRLTRRWAPGGRTVLWIMLNPSTADAVTDDATIRKCVGFSRRFGANALVAVNLFAFRATNPMDLFVVADPVGPENPDAIREAAREADVAVAAWGNVHGRLWLAAQPSVHAARAIAGLKCLGRTRDGAPRHPSRLPYITPIEAYAA